MKPTFEDSQAWRPSLPGGSVDILPWQCERFATPSSVLPEGGIYLEVGNFFGRSLVHMAELRPDVRIIACDPWAEEWYDAGERLPVGPDRARRDKFGGMYEAFLAGVREHSPGLLEGMYCHDLREGELTPMVVAANGLPRLTVLRGPSARALSVLPDACVDVAFLDGDHTVPGLLEDIRQAKRITKRGGLISGHDFHDPAWGSEVTRAVRLAFGSGYALAPWPVEREGWSKGACSVWYAETW